MLFNIIDYILKIFLLINGLTIVFFYYKVEKIFLINVILNILNVKFIIKDWKYIWLKSC